MRPWVALGLLVLTNAIWGSSYVVAKVALTEIPPPLLASLRFTLAAVVLWLVIGARARTIHLPTRDDTFKLLGLGVLGVAINGLLGFWGISLTTATDSALMIVGEVIFTTLLALALAGDHLSRLRGLGLLSGLVGAIVLIVGGNSDPTATAPSRALGNVLILSGLAFESLFTVLGTRLTQRYQPLSVLTLSFTGSCIVWLPIIAWYVISASVPWPSETAIAGVLYLALVNSVACYLIWFAVLRFAGATFGAISLLAQPLVGAALGIAVLGDPVLPSTLVGGACVLACLALAPSRGR